MNLPRRLTAKEYAVEILGADATDPKALRRGMERVYHMIETRRIKAVPKKRGSRQAILIDLYPAEADERAGHYEIFRTP